MAVGAIFPVLLLSAVTRIACNPHGIERKNDDVSTQYGEILKPPPPPPLSNIIPVPFHGGRNTRQNANLGYEYQQPPPPPPPSLSVSTKFKLPSPFYKQYNFKFVPPPQPFSSTVAPSMFQKVSGWLFPSKETKLDSTVQPSNVNQPKKDCNTCNLVPWIPVIRYDLAAKNQANVSPTYGVPSPTASPILAPYSPQPFLTSSVPHSVYGPPSTLTSPPLVSTLSSTYGPPSPTHVADFSSSKYPLSSTYGSSSFQPSSNYGVPSSSFGTPSSSYGVPSTYGAPSSSWRAPSSSYGAPAATFDTPGSTYGAPSATYIPPSSSFSAPNSYSGSSSYPGPVSSYGIPSSTYGPPSSSSYVTPTPSFSHQSTTYRPFSESADFVPPINEAQLFKDPEPSALSNDLDLPKVSQPTGFKNSYGEPISSVYNIAISYPVSATAAESSKIKSVLPHDFNKLSNNQNQTLALANPAPFQPHKARNIHTLQPVALPNLSVSPLPPIFNAKPFRPLLPLSFIHRDAQKNNVQLTKSVPVSEFTHSIEYPPTIIQSPLIDIDQSSNQTKTYRNIANGYVIDQHRDIFPQASEDHHVATTNTNQNLNDNSFETTGSDATNDIYDIPSGMRLGNFVANNKGNFADLRGVSDSEVDKYRSENNLQSIDSPLLYLKPSAPHKEFDNFAVEVSTQSRVQDYEMYDDIPTTTAPQLSTPSHLFDDVRIRDDSNSPTAQEDSNKPKIVQIIIPYTTEEEKRPNNHNYDTEQDWATGLDEEFQARKVPYNTENYYDSNTPTESYDTETTTTETSPTPADIYETEVLNTPAILNDLYDVREPPFDIIKLQNNIDDWTEQQFSEQQRTTARSKVTGKYAHAKQIPDEYFTTMSPISNFVTTTEGDYYDHEGSSSVQHSITDDSQEVYGTKFNKEYRTIQRGHDKPIRGQNEIVDDNHKPHIYTAASSFRSTTTSTTTPAPWGKIETSISPLTKEKVYVVTSKPWRETNVTDWFAGEPFESMKTVGDAQVSASDNLPFKSPRFINRPAFGMNEPEIMRSEATSHAKNWHQSINDLEARMLMVTNSTLFREDLTRNSTNNMDETSAVSTTAETPSEDHLHR